MKHAEDHRRRQDFDGRRHAGAQRTGRGCGQGVQVRRLGEAFQDQDCGEEFDRLFLGEKYDLLLGRKTYEIYARYWPHQVWEDVPNGGIPTVFNAIRKYVVSRSGEVDTSWQGSALLRDTADVQRLRDEDGPNLVTQGSTELVHALLANDLVDAMTQGVVNKLLHEPTVRVKDAAGTPRGDYYADALASLFDLPTEPTVETE